MQNLVQSGRKTVAKSYDSAYRYMDDIYSNDGYHLNVIYFKEYETQHTSGSA